MMPEWHHSDFSRTVYALPESTKKKKFKIKFQVLLKFAQILPDYSFVVKIHTWLSLNSNILPYSLYLLVILTVDSHAPISVITLSHFVPLMHPCRHSHAPSSALMTSFTSLQRKDPHVNPLYVTNNLKCDTTTLPRILALHSTFAQWPKGPHTNTETTFQCV